MPLHSAISPAALPHPRDQAKNNARARTAVLLGLFLAGLSGCASDKPATLAVRIRDHATQLAAPNTLVIAETPSRNHPFSIASLLGQTKDESSRATTDTEGKAQVTCLINRPLRITLIAEGRDAGFIFIDPHAATTGQAMDWTFISARDATGQTNINNGSSASGFDLRIEPLP